VIDVLKSFLNSIYFPIALGIIYCLYFSRSVWKDVQKGAKREAEAECDFRCDDSTCDSDERITPLKEDRILNFTKKTIDGVANSLVTNAQKANSDEWELFTVDTAAVILRMIAERMDEDVTLAEFLDARKNDVSSNIF